MQGLLVWKNTPVEMARAPLRLTSCSTATRFLPDLANVLANICGAEIPGRRTALFSGWVMSDTTASATSLIWSKVPREMRIKDPWVPAIISGKQLWLIPALGF